MSDKKHTEEEFISDFKIENGVLKEYNGNPANVIIPSCVTEIGESAFRHCKTLESITVPDSVKSIGEMAFYDCTKFCIILIKPF